MIGDEDVLLVQCANDAHDGLVIPPPGPDMILTINADGEQEWILLSELGVQGPPGAQGVTGAGAQGSQGATGAQGTQGTQGVSPQGPQGTTGTVGAAGNTGTTGKAGAQGVQGAQGTQGVQGAQGPQGTPPGGPTTSPTWIAVGTADTTGTAGSTPAYGSNNAGDLFVMVVAGRLTACTTPAGWTLQVGPNDKTGRRCYIFTRDARSSGGESGTVSVTLTANSQISTIHTFRNVATSSFVEDPDVGGQTGNGTGPLPPAITSTGAHRLAMFASADGSAVGGPASITSTGGTWTQRAELTTTTGNDCGYTLYTCDLVAAGTITGGNGGETVDEHSTCGFALVGV